ncbi:hypothetical protein [Streptomyces blastmyceticus]|uniref:Uncharacterized protein n=1 Tax=Streptomyces blastmyceticus TaxID=68180 RepID=A0ABP3H9U3_9ACTN
MTVASNQLPSALAVRQNVRAAWDDGCPTELTSGETWDIVEIDYELGRRARAYMAERYLGLGLYIASGSRRAIWVLVPLGTAYRLIGIPGVTVPSPGWKLTAPPPGRYRADRTWVLPPTVLLRAPWAALTDTGHLREALEATQAAEAPRCL